MTELPETVGFWAQAARHPDKAAVITADGTITRYGELMARTNRIANLLHDRGLRAGDHLAFLMGNRVSTLEVVLACVQLGVIYTPINRGLTGGEAAYILRDCGAKAFVVDAEYQAAATVAAEQFPAGLSVRFSVGDIPTFEPLSRACASYPDSLPERTVAGGALYYTSGTTGRPKGVLRSTLGTQTLTESLSGFIKTAAVNGCPPDGVYLVQGPLHHSGPLGASINVLCAGATVVLMGKWDAQTCLELIERHRVCATQMVPTMFHRLLALPAEVRARYDVSSLRGGVIKHGSALCPVEVKRAMIDWFGPVLMETYGGQEGVVTNVNSADWLAHPGTVGRVDRVAVRVYDDEGRVLGPGEVGNLFAALGDVEYYHAPEKTAASRHGEFFTLGDVGYVDEEGWLYLVDRRVDLIISGGVNIYPAEVEAILLRHEAVRDVAVIGVPNPEWGQEVRAVIELADGFTGSDDLRAGLIDFCRAHAARYKCPRSVVFIATLPRDALGKLQRWQLREVLT